MGGEEHLAFWASSCFSKLTNPKPFERPVLSIMTLTLSVFPARGKESIRVKKGAHRGGAAGTQHCAQEPP